MFTWASKKLFGRADERHGEAASLDETGHPREELRVRDVGAVPGEKVVHSMDGGDCDVKGVRQRLERQEVLGDDLQPEPLGRVRQLEDGNVDQEGHAPRNRFGIASTRLLDDERRHEQLEVTLPGPPPVFRDLLMPGHDQIPRRARGEVADDGRLKVHASSHAAMLALRDLRRPASQALPPSCDAFSRASWTRARSARSSRGSGEAQEVWWQGAGR